jgi:hypothetical protein
MRKTLLALALATAGLMAAVVPASASAATAPTTALTTPNPAESCSAAFFHNDPRLGPQHLPELGPVGAELIGYERTGGLPASQFLATYYNPAANGGAGGWIYPPDNGYVIGPDGNPIEFHLTVVPGTEMDRYGSQYGSFLAPAGLPYAERSIPPQSLDSNPAESCNYHDYRVLKSFSVDAGPIAPWFAQPGGGLQYQLNGTLVPGAPAALNVLWLVTNGYLEPIG